MLLRLLRLFINKKPKVEYINVMYECILVKDGIIKRNLDTREYNYIKCVDTEKGEIHAKRNRNNKSDSNN